MLSSIFRARRPEKSPRVTLSPEGRRILRAIIAHHDVPGLSASGAIEALIREKAVEMGIEPVARMEDAA